MSSKTFNKPRLSKGILEMKFMQRTKAKVDKEIEAAEGRAMYSDEITEKMLNSNSNFIIEPSFIYCENLIDGRLSFRGMNPEIERLLEIEREEKAAAKRKQSADVSDEEMAKFFQKKTAGAAKTIENKFPKSKKFKKVNNVANVNNDSIAGAVGKKYNNKRNHDGDDSITSAVKNKKPKFIKPKDDDEID